MSNRNVLIFVCIICAKTGVAENMFNIASHKQSNELSFQSKHFKKKQIRSSFPSREDKQTIEPHCTHSQKLSTSRI